MSAKLHQKLEIRFWNVKYFNYFMKYYIIHLHKKY